ncbi:MAG: CoA transferase [Proteobacteria bacterium]|nr:CoA transferase [Pseudomonadota bacterium]
MEQVLEGLRVLDFGQYIPGPYTGMLLAEQGADVIKVERPGGDPYRSEPGFKVFNRSKKGIVLDLKRTECREIACGLAAESDVIIENFSPGVADRLGIGYETIHRINPRAVYLSISGFGRKGPYRDHPGWDPIVSSTSGMHVGQSGGEDFPPTYLVLPFASYYAAFLSAFGVTMALYAREFTGKGQRVEISLLNAIYAAYSPGAVYFEGKVMLPPAHAPQGRSPVYRFYHGSDGKWFFLALGNQTFFTKFAVSMDHYEWLTDERLEGIPFMIMPPYHEEIAEEFQAIFSTKTRNHWLEFLKSEDIPCAPADPVASYMDDPQIAANSMIHEVEDTEWSKGRQMGIPVNLVNHPGRHKGPHPQLGEHTEEILKTVAGLSGDEITRIKQYSEPASER